MCFKRSSVIAEIDNGKRVRIDPCMRNLIEFINCETNYKTLACCCGHGRYQMSIIISHKHYGEFTGKAIELISGLIIPRTKRFYQKDKDGFFFIPELL